MAKEWKWLLSHTLDSKKYALYENGQITSAALRNTGETRLRIYDFGIEFEWQKKPKFWWHKKCDILLNPKEEAELPVVKFRIPIDVEPRTYKYKVGVATESYTLKDDEFEAQWKDHGIVWGLKEYEIEIARHPDRGYQVFISHSNHTEDKPLVKMLATLLSNSGISSYIAEETPEYGENLWKKIKRAISSADRVIILWTKCAAKSGDVREELGITVGRKGPRFVPIIEKNVKPKGSLIGTEYISLDRDKCKDVFIKLTKDLIKFSEEKAKRTKKIKPEEELPF